MATIRRRSRPRWRRRTLSRRSRPSPILRACWTACRVRLRLRQVLRRVVAVSTDANGHATRVRVALDDMPATQLWIDQDDPRLQPGPRFHRRPRRPRPGDDRRVALITSRPLPGAPRIHGIQRSSGPRSPSPQHVVADLADRPVPPLGGCAKPMRPPAPSWPKEPSHQHRREVARQLIAQAIAQRAGLGSFANAPGRGQPLDLRSHRARDRLRLQQPHAVPPRRSSPRTAAPAMRHRRSCWPPGSVPHGPRAN